MHNRSCSAAFHPPQNTPLVLGFCLSAEVMHVLAVLCWGTLTFGARLFHGIEDFFTNTATKNPPVF